MRIGVLTSGGDAPGMNAALRTVAVVGSARGHEVLGIRRGFEGLLEGDVRSLDLEEVDGVSRHGGTMLGSARSKRFPTEEGQKAACARIASLGLDALVVIGGNGSLAGAHRLASTKPCCIVGLPASIDNDVGHSGMAIGADTAVNTIVEACDRISDTARAHRRVFIVEVMGRRCGFLAMRAGIAAEADVILYGEDGQLEEAALLQRLDEGVRKCFREGRAKMRCLIIKAEGVTHPTSLLARKLQDSIAPALPGVDVRATVLGHVVRGGNPSALDRVIAQRLALGAVSACERDAHDTMLGWQVPFDHGAPTDDPSVRTVPIAEVLSETEKLLSGDSPVVKKRLELLNQVRNILAY